MSNCTVRLGLSLMIVIGFWPDQLPAQEILVVPEIPYEPAYHPESNAAFWRRPTPTPADHRLRRALNHFDLGCQADPYTPAASSFRYEMLFVFGSSRWFLSQPCVPGQFCGDRHRQR